jgi:integrase
MLDLRPHLTADRGSWMKVKGEGSWRARKDGLFEFALPVGKTKSGNTRRKSFYGKTRKEVLAKLEAWRNKRATGQLPSNPSKITVGELLDRWLALREGIEENTRATYENYIRAYLKPNLEYVRLSDLTSIAIDEFTSKLTRRGKRTKNGVQGAGLPVSARVKQYAFLILNAVLNQAVRWGFIASNPADGAMRPPKSKTRRRVWTQEQARQFLEAIRGDRLEALYRILILTGPRRGELLGLRWSAIDWKRSTIRLDHSVVFINGKRHAKDRLKNEASHRTFTVPHEVLTLLRARRKSYDAERKLAGVNWNEGDYIFCSSVGTPLYESTLREHHKSLVERAGVPFITLHEIRHTYTSLARLAGVDIKEVSRRLGHASVQTTTDTYQHLYTEQDTAAALSSDVLLGKRKKLKKPHGNDLR